MWSKIFNFFKPKGKSKTAEHEVDLLTVNPKHTNSLKSLLGATSLPPTLSLVEIQQDIYKRKPNLLKGADTEDAVFAHFRDVVSSLVKLKNMSFGEALFVVAVLAISREQQAKMWTGKSIQDIAENVYLKL